MKSLLRFVGRLLFITLLLSSAVLKIKQPTAFTNDVTNGYTTIRSLHSGVGDFLPTVNSVSICLSRLMLTFHLLLLSELLELSKD